MTLQTKVMKNGSNRVTKWLQQSDFVNLEYLEFFIQIILSVTKITEEDGSTIMVALFRASAIVTAAWR